MDWGWYMVEQGLVDPERLIEADRMARATGARLQDILIESGWASERDVYLSIAQEMQLPFVDLNKQSSDPATIAFLPREFAVHHDVLPLKRDSNQNVLWLATVEPDNQRVAEEVRMICDCAIRPVLAAPAALREAIARSYDST